MLMSHDCVLKPRDLVQSQLCAYCVLTFMDFVYIFHVVVSGIDRQTQQLEVNC